MKEIMKARKKDTPVKPPAQLEPQPGDYNLPPALYLACKVFSRLKSKPNPDKFPGTLVLRRFRPGEIICRQNDPGWTAFAILAADDIRAMHAERDRLLAELPGKLKKAIDAKKEEEIEKLREQIGALGKSELPPMTDESAAPPQPAWAATVYLGTSGQDAPRRQGLLARLFSSKRGLLPRSKRFIPVDPGTTLDYGTRKAVLGEGRLFGEWSCIYGTPRSATIVAERDCYVLEMLRNVLDSILGDKQFQDDTDKRYVASVLQNHLAGLSIFSELTPEQLGEIRAGVELLRCTDGQIICDKGAASDCMYIVRRGVVKVLLNEWPLLGVEDVSDWKALAAGLGSDEGATPAQLYLARKLDAGSREKLLRAGTEEAFRPGAAAAINAVLKDRQMRMGENPKTKKPEPAAELKPLLDAPAFKEAVADDFARDDKDWSDQDWRRFNRLVLEYAYPGALRTVRLPKKEEGDDVLVQSRSETILAYLTQGDFFGEMGVMLDQPRSATCVAYVHPRPEAEEIDPQGDRWRRDEARIELVKISHEMFRQLCEKYPSIKEKVHREIETRLQRTRKHAEHRWEDSEPLQTSDRLGLIQGQKLMLIDLDRCTRCDECVQACVNTHTDGRSRLFLDGPRFGRYLVPTTCRSCRDPVCMIGCPVGSIRRGTNLEMVIEDWCIGCQLCAKNCPYGSIQMHDLGLLPEESHGWTYRPAALVAGEAWTQPNFKDRDWLPGASPFWSDLDLAATLTIALKQIPADGATPSRALCFRRSFNLDGDLLARPDSGIKVVIDAAAQEITVAGTGRQAKVTSFVPVWINGKPVPAERWKPDREQFVFEITGEDLALLHPGRNTVAVQATPIPGKRAVLLQLAIDEIHASGAVIPLRAVVCDQCSTLPEQAPACVHACPHDAAMRVDAWKGIPVR